MSTVDLILGDCLYQVQKWSFPGGKTPLLDLDKV